MTGPIPTRDESPDLSRFPDFLILGPQRTGTTWLHRNLLMHPQLLLHREKETYFFNTQGNPEHPRFRWATLEDYLDSYRESLSERLAKHWICLRKALSFYRPKLIGEATASYALLPDQVIAAIAGFQPELKGIMMLRHPIDRAWSHAKKTLVRGSTGEVGIEEFRSYFHSEGQKQRAGYGSMIDAWRRHLKPGHLYLGRFDRISQCPRDLVEDIERFLGVKPRALRFNRHFDIELNPTKRMEMPAELKAFLGSFLEEEIADYERLLDEIGEGRAL